MSNINIRLSHANGKWPLHLNCGSQGNHCRPPGAFHNSLALSCKIRAYQSLKVLLCMIYIILQAWNIALKYSLRDMRMLRWRKRLPPSHLTVTSEKLSGPFSWHVKINLIKMSKIQDDSSTVFPCLPMAGLQKATPSLHQPQTSDPRCMCCF